MASALQQAIANAKLFFQPKNISMARQNISNAWQDLFDPRLKGQEVPRLQSAVAEVPRQQAQLTSNIRRSNMPGAVKWGAEMLSNLALNPAQSYLQGIANRQAGRAAFMRPGAESKFVGGAQMLKGVGQTMAPLTNFYNRFNLIASTPQNQQQFASPVPQSMLSQPKKSWLGDNKLRTFATSAIRAQTGIDTMSPEFTPERNIKLPWGLGDINPIEIAGSMAGFVNNPINKQFFRLTEKFIPGGKIITKKGAINLLKSIVAWTAKTGARGAAEDIILNMQDYPLNGSFKDKMNYLVSNGIVGAGTEIGGRIIMGTGQKAAEASMSQIVKHTDFIAPLLKQISLRMGEVRTENGKANVLDLSRPRNDLQIKNYESLLKSTIRTIQNGGKIDPVEIYPNGVIKDGAWKWDAYKALGIKDIPVKIAPFPKKVEGDWDKYLADMNTKDIKVEDTKAELPAKSTKGKLGGQEGVYKIVESKYKGLGGTPYEVVDTRTGKVVDGGNTKLEAERAMSYLKSTLDTPAKTNAEFNTRLNNYEKTLTKIDPKNLTTEEALYINKNGELLNMGNESHENVVTSLLGEDAHVKKFAEQSEWIRMNRGRSGRSGEFNIELGAKPNDAQIGLIYKLSRMYPDSTFRLDFWSSDGYDLRGTAELNGSQASKLMSDYQQGGFRQAVREANKLGVMMAPFKLGGQEGFIKPDEFIPGKLKAKLGMETPKAELPAKPGAELKGETKLTPQQELLAKMETATAQRAAETKAQRGAQMERLSMMASGKKGGELIETGKKALKGKFEYTTAADVDRAVKTGDLKKMYTQISSTNMGIEKQFKATNALYDYVQNGRKPQPAEMKLLKEIFGADVMEGMEKGILTVPDKLAYVMGIPRAAMATWDLSAPLRQGIMLATYKPRIFLNSFLDMFKYAFSEDAYQQGKYDVKSDPFYETAMEHKLPLSEMDEADPRLKEEAIMSGNILEKVPGLGRLTRASNRAYTGFLNKARFDTYKDLYKQADANGKLTPKVADELADFVGALTGRGKLGSKMERAAPMLNSVFFSPRLIASRLYFLDPRNYLETRPDSKMPLGVSYAGKESLRAFFQFFGTAATILGLAKLAGADVNMDDPTNADFGKIRVGNTRYDIMGGFLPYFRLIAQEVTGKVTSSQTGDVITVGEGYKPLSRAQILQRFFENKMSPVASFTWNLLKGENFIGEKFDLPVEVVNRFIPMVIQDIYDLAKERDSIALGMLMGSPAVFGVGAQTYGTQELKTGTDRFGRPTAQIKQPGGMAEDVVGLLRGKQPLGTTKTYNARTYYEQLKAMPKEEAQQQWNTIKQYNPDLADKIMDVDKEMTMGITPEDRRMKMMGVKNGDRAQFIYDKMEKMTYEERVQYYKELKYKKVITDEVDKQLRLLFMQNQNAQ